MELGWQRDGGGDWVAQRWGWDGFGGGMGMETGMEMGWHRDGDGTGMEMA